MTSFPRHLNLYFGSCKVLHRWLVGNVTSQLDALRPEVLLYTFPGFVIYATLWLNFCQIFVDYVGIYVSILHVFSFGCALIISSYR